MQVLCCLMLLGNAINESVVDFCKMINHGDACYISADVMGSLYEQNVTHGKKFRPVPKQSQKD